jgi:hypothetical protein
MSSYVLARALEHLRKMAELSNEPPPMPRPTRRRVGSEDDEVEGWMAMGDPLRRPHRKTRRDAGGDEK